MPTVTEADIFSRVIDPSNPTLSADGAKAFLQLSFSEDDHARMAELAERSNEGTLTDEERREYEGYVFVGDVLAMLKSKARLSLARRSRRRKWTIPSGSSSDTGCDTVRLESARPLAPSPGTPGEGGVRVISNVKSL